MTHATSVVRRTRTPPPRVAWATLARMAVLAGVLLGVMAVAFVLCLAWLGGEASDLYTRRSVGMERAFPSVDAVSATLRAPRARFSR